MIRTGWLLDVYTDAQHGLTLWFLGEDGERSCLHQIFPITFYAAGTNSRLRALWLFLRKQAIPVRLSRTERRDLFQTQPITVLAIEVQNPAEQPGLFAETTRAFPDLVYYDADLPISLRYAAVYNTFPMGKCQIMSDEEGWIHEITPLETPWQLEPSQPPLRILSIEPDVNPRHAEPAYLTLQYGRTRCQLSLAEPRPLLVNLKAILGRYDPDLILSAWGDTWMLPMLIKLSEDWKIPLALNRDPNQKIAFHNERTYFSYGQIIYRGQQVHLFGRWHVDVYNAMMFHDYEMEGIWELARVTALPVQTVARVSPGTGISSMQILTALRQGILVPWHKQQVEYSKSALELLNADRGGLVYQPLVGLHQNVAEIDFISMYPSIMAHHNISPETTEWRCDSHEWEPQAATEPPGLIPQTLTPLLEKRIALKQHLMYLSHWDPQYKLVKARAAAHKWLLVTCFGYLGYKNARFGRIEAHEAVTAYGREALLRAKEAAEDMGFTVLHMYVDGMWIQKPGCKTPSAFQPLLDEIVKRTGLPIALDGIYRQIAFLPSQVNPRLPVANRYFGVFQDGSLKLRGIEARRQDTPPFIVETQMEILKLFSKANTLKELHSLLPEIIALIRQRLEDLRSGRIPTAKMFVTQKIGRELGEYRVLSPAARALGQLEAIGKQIKPGQHIRFLYTLGKPGVHAWDLPETLDPQRLDVPRYAELLLRAGATILQPLGIQEKSLHIWVTANVSPDTVQRLL